MIIDTFKIKEDFLARKSPRNLTEQYNLRVDRELKAMSRRAKSLGLPHLKGARRALKEYYKSELSKVEPEVATLIPGAIGKAKAEAS